MDCNPPIDASFVINRLQGLFILRLAKGFIEFRISLFPFAQELRDFIAFLRLHSFLMKVEHVGFPFVFVVSVDDLCGKLGVLELTAVRNNHTLFGVSTRRTDGLDGLDDRPAILDLPKGDVLAVEMLAPLGREEKL